MMSACNRVSVIAVKKRRSRNTKAYRIVEFFCVLVLRYRLPNLALKIGLSRNLLFFISKYTEKKGKNTTNRTSKYDTTIERI